MLNQNEYFFLYFKTFKINYYHVYNLQWSVFYPYTKNPLRKRMSGSEYTLAGSEYLLAGSEYALAEVQIRIIMGF